MRASLLSSLFIIADLLLLVESKSKLLQAENVFGWQHKSTNTRSDPRAYRQPVKQSCKTVSSLKRSENRNNWQQHEQSRKSTSQKIVNASSKSNESANNPLNNIKLQPRKKELWLPWPLGELRNDYYRFAEQQKHQSQNQARLHTYYTDPSNSFIEQSKDWAGKLFQRGQSFTRNITGKQEQIEQPNYWVKETTTPMATASASMKEKRHKSKKRAMREGDAKDDDKKWDHDMIFKYVKLQMKVRLRQLGYVGSDFSVHLPPASPTLLLLYMLPSTQDPLRRLVKFSLTGATISWMHSEATKYRRFAPLPIMQGMNVRRPNLLPFLPEELQSLGGVEIVQEKSKEDNVNATHTLWDPFQSFGTISSAYRSWIEEQGIRDKRSHEQRRVVTQSRLLELVESINSTETSENSYALITGASRGIGRALAVELARYRIPLILVARDVTKLTKVAHDIEKYYNVPCRVLQADLSTPDCASRIHAATTEAGLKVDILINNAGVCDQGEMIEGDTDDIMNMIQVNVGSVVQLSQLYGRDMKERRRGRMLFVSSMAGAMPGCASVGVYAATKAFEKSLAASLGREMERYGVGVTCLLPGAVKDTAFASRSDVETAVCFQVPGYAKNPEDVAGEGIKAMMLGYPEVYPGWENKVFAKFLLTHLPARLSNMIGEYAWSPWQFGMLPNTKVENTESSKATHSSSHNTWKFRRPSGTILKLPDLPKIQMPRGKLDDILLSNDPMNVNETKVGDENTSTNDSFDVPMTSNHSIVERISPDLPSDESCLPSLGMEEEIPLGLDGVNNGGEVNARIPESNESWYPSMLDQKDYDFRDRRLDY